MQYRHGCAKCASRRPAGNYAPERLRFHIVRPVFYLSWYLSVRFVLTSARLQVKLRWIRLCASRLGWPKAIPNGRTQHAVRAGESIPVPPWTRPRAGESIPMQRWNSPQGRHKSIIQILLRGCQITAGSLQLSCFAFAYFNWMKLTVIRLDKTKTLI